MSPIKCANDFRVILTVSFALGVLTVFSFAPFYLPPVAFLTLAGLIFLWRNISVGKAAWVGFTFGLGLFGAGVSWIYVSLHDFGGLPGPFAALATLLLCLFLSLFPAAVGTLQARFNNHQFVRCVVLIPALWVTSEWIRSWIFTGFPWLSIGYSQVPSSPLSGFAPILGVYGLSLLTVVCAGLLAMLAQHLYTRDNSRTTSTILILVAIAGSGLALNRVEWTHAVGVPLKVSLLQGNIEQSMKWREDKIMHSLDTYMNLVLNSSGQLIILPETALPLFSYQVPPQYLAQLAAHAKRNNGDVLIGLPEKDSATNQYYNSMFSLGSSPVQTYRKFHLVPFGEYIPFKFALDWLFNVLDIPLLDFSRGTTTPQPMQLGQQKIAINICYEDVFGEEIIRQLPQATLLVNVSNDAWFGDSLAPAQHLQISQMRAIETGRTMMRATNTGVTAIIDHRGQVIARAPGFVTTSLEGSVQGRQGETPYVKWGNNAMLIMLALMLLISFRYRKQ